MKSSDLTKEWLDLARTDIDAARFLTQMQPPPLEIVCFHCQQAAEKSLKALLQTNRAEITKTHDLLEILKRSRSYHADIDQLESACNRLNDYSVVVRYPKQLNVVEAD